MLAEKWQKIEEIFLTAVEIADRAERESFLAEACANEVELRQAVDKLIREDEQAEYFLHRPVVEESGIHVLADLIDRDPLIGHKLGNYQILREIGAGGMGSVYLAERADGSFQKKVAIKVVKRGMDTKFILSRFRQERQVLALLNHPFITTLLDGGTTAEGLPYFVMDFIEGEPLHRYADHLKLSIASRLQLFLEVCEAVEYAHQNKIIHRDLKPNNILIKADGTPRLLDFGIAKVFNSEFQDGITIEQTVTRMRLMTPEYASPEQVKGEKVSTVSDIYSLGVLLYELLSGHRPYQLKRRSPFEISQVICEEKSVPLSEAVTGKSNFVSGGISNSVAEVVQARSVSSLQDLQDELTDSLERIVQKSLRKNPLERYQSVAALAQDIKGYLENRPITAEKFADEEFLITSEKPVEKYKVAILPLTVLGKKDADEEFLGLGLADALVLRLSNLRRFIIRPTSSVLKFQDAKIDSRTAGRELKVEFVVEGTIRRVAERIRVSAQLFDVKNDATVWAGTFDENFTDVLQIEDSISERVSQALIPKLTGEETRLLQKRGTNSPAAYEAYLRGRFYANQFTDDALPKAVAAYQEAVRLDPNYALPHVGLADFYVLSGIFGIMPGKEAYPLAKAELQQALRADSSLAEAYSLSAFIALLYDWNWTEAEKLVNKALEINPNYHLAHDVRAHILASQGISQEAIAEIMRAEELDPLAPRAKLMTSCICYQSRRFNRGAAKAEEAVLMHPGSPAAALHFGNSLTHDGRTRQAIEFLTHSAQIWEMSAIPKYMLSHALVANGQMAEARQLLDEVLTFAETNYVKPYFVAMTCVALGENDLASTLR